MARLTRTSESTVEVRLSALMATDDSCGRWPNEDSHCWWVLGKPVV